MAQMPEMPALPQPGEEVTAEMLHTAVKACHVREIMLDHSPAGEQQRGEDAKRLAQLAAAAAVPHVMHQQHLLGQVLDRLDALQQGVQALQVGQQALQEGQQALKEGQDALQAHQDNEHCRRYNTHSLSSKGVAALRPLRRERAAAGGAHAVGALPPAGVFPADTQALSQLTRNQINALEDFYGEPFAGHSVADRRKSFQDYVS